MASAGAAAVVAAAAAAAAAAGSADAKYPLPPTKGHVHDPSAVAAAAAAAVVHDNDDDDEAAQIRDCHTALALLRKRIAVARAVHLMADGGTGGLCYTLLLLQQQQQQQQKPGASGSASAAAARQQHWRAHRPARMSCATRRACVDRDHVRGAAWCADSAHVVTCGSASGGTVRIWDTTRFAGGHHASALHAVEHDRLGVHARTCRGTIALDYNWSMCVSAHRGGGGGGGGGSNSSAHTAQCAVEDGLLVAEGGLGRGVRVWRTPPLLPRYAPLAGASASSEAAHAQRHDPRWVQLLQPPPGARAAPDATLPSDSYVPAIGWGSRSQLVMGSGDGHVRLWDVDRALCTARVSTCDVALHDTGNDVNDVAVLRAHTDANVCVSACVDGLAYLCDFRTPTAAAAQTAGKPVMALAATAATAAAAAGAGAGAGARSPPPTAADVVAEAKAYGVELTRAAPPALPGARVTAPPLAPAAPAAPGAVAVAAGVAAVDPPATHYSARYSAYYRPSRPAPNKGLAAVRESELCTVVVLGAHGNGGGGGGDSVGGGGGGPPPVVATADLAGRITVWDVRNPAVPLNRWHGATVRRRRRHHHHHHNNNNHNNHAAAVDSSEHDDDDDDAADDDPLGGPGGMNVAPRLAFSASGRWLFATHAGPTTAVGGGAGGGGAAAAVGRGGAVDVLTYDVLTGTLAGSDDGGGVWSHVHDARVTGLALSPDGRAVLTSSFDGHVRVYE